MIIFTICLLFDSLFERIFVLFLHTTKNYNIFGTFTLCKNMFTRCIIVSQGETADEAILKLMQQRKQTPTIEPDQTVHVSFITPEDNGLLGSLYLSSKSPEISGESILLCRPCNQR